MGRGDDDGPLLIAEKFRNLINRRNYLVSRFDKAYDEKERINVHVLGWLDAVEKLIKETNDWKEPCWGDDTIKEEIKKLDGDSIFEPFYIPRDLDLESNVPRAKYFDLDHVSSMNSDSGHGKVTSRRKLHQTPRAEAAIVKSPSELLPLPPISNPRAKAVNSFGKSKSPLPPLYIETFTPFKSSRKASEALFNKLRDDNCQVIGLYGKRGSGKSALVRSEIDRYKTIFSNVVFPIAYKNQDSKSIQGGIATWLRVNFGDDHDEKSFQRAKVIETELNKIAGTTLIVLDHFLKDYDPIELGIPYSNRCKVLLITREQTTCCHAPILLEPVTRDEAWELLQQLSHLTPESKQFEVARDIAFKCMGLPGLVNDVISSLKDKPSDMLEKSWEETLQSLNHSTARYQIFLSFRGEDTRESFTIPLYQALCGAGYKTFFDADALKRGDRISTILEEIKESRFSIVILSKKYADSDWCLKELVQIIECQKTKNQLVLPVFCDVIPGDVRNVRGSYAEAMAKHKEKFAGLKEEDMNTLEKWKDALFKVCDNSGIHYTGSRKECIEEIVKIANDNRHRLHIQNMYKN